MPKTAGLARRPWAYDPWGLPPNMSGQLVEQWPEKKIEDVLHPIIDFRGRTPKKLGLEWGGGDIHALSALNVKDDGIDFTRTKNFGSEELYSKWMTKGEAALGDVILTTEAPLGKVAQIPDSRKYILSQRVVLLKPKKEILNADFLAWVLRSPDFQKKLQRNETGATVGGIRMALFKNLTIPIPPLKVQKHIVNILNEAFEQISNSENSTMVNIANVHSFFENSRSKELSGNGFDWPVKRLDEICSRFEYGSSAKSHAEGNVPVLRMGNIQNGEIDWSDLKYSSDTNEIENFLLRPNDVLFNRTNSAEHVGKSAIYRGGQEALFAGYLIRIHYDPELLNPEYLNFFLNGKSARNYGKSVMSESINQANINATKLKQYTLHLPPIEIQHSVVDRLNGIRVETQATVSILQEKLSNLVELRQSIMQEAFNGNLRIAEGLAGQS
jgi:type I restriction enzyme S subunit